MSDPARAYSPDYDPNPPAHYRATTTPVGDQLLCECLCGAEYYVAAGPGEGRRLSRADAEHAASACGVSSEADTAVSAGDHTGGAR